MKRNDKGEIEMFQRYDDRGPGWHAEADQRANDLVVEKTAKYYNLAEQYRRREITKPQLEEALRSEFLTTRPGGALLGGTDARYAPKPSVTGEIIEGGRRWWEK